MDNNTAVGMVLCLALLAAGLAIAAECSKLKSSDMLHDQVDIFNHHCRYPKSPDYKFAVAAAMLTSGNAALIFYINYIAYCVYKERNDNLPVIAIICLVFSGIASVGGFSTLASGATFSKSRDDKFAFVCSVISSGYYIAGAILVLKACGLGITSFNIMMNGTDNAPQPSAGQTVQMGKTTLNQPDIYNNIHAAAL